MIEKDKKLTINSVDLAKKIYNGFAWLLRCFLFVITISEFVTECLIFGQLMFKLDLSKAQVLVLVIVEDVC